MRRRRPMQIHRPRPKRASLGLTLALGVVAAALASFGLTGAAAEPLPITYTIDGISGTNGWYRGNTYGNFVVVRWTINVAVKQDCPHAMEVTGPTTGTTRSCTIILLDGSQLTRQTAPIKIDATPPTGVSASLSRSPDFNGWYNHPVGVSWHGSDATSGIASCGTVMYAGPDRSATSVSSGCTDKAGNSTAAPISLSYDATAPVLSKLAVASRAGSNLVRWTSTSASDDIVVQRRQRGGKSESVVFRGKASSFTDRKVAPSLEYTYAVRSFDQAGNASRKALVVGLPKVLTLGKTPYVPRAAGKPILRWPRVRGARYYHVQLFRGSKRIFVAWPRNHQLGLPAAWRLAGHRYRLGPGRYRWYAWAGLGDRSFARYRTIGSAQFIVPR
jgi:hypothetical protein